MRYSPLLSFKDSLAAGIMQIDREVVVEPEDDASQGIALSSSLHHSIGTRNQLCSRYLIQVYFCSGLHIPHIVVSCQEVTRISGMMRHIVQDDASWHKPFRVDIHSLDTAVEQWRLGLQRSASYTHRERVLSVYRHQLVSRDVHHHIFLMVPDIILLSPSASFQIHQYFRAFPSGQSLLFQLIQEYAVEGIVGLYRFQKNGERIRSHTYPFHCFGKERIIRMVHLHIKESSEPYRSLDGIIGIRSHRIQAVQHEVGIHIAKPLSRNISQIRFGQPVLQSSHHPVHLVLLSVQVKVSESLDVFCNLIHIKALLIETDFLYVAQVCEQRIGTMVYTVAVYP